MLSSTIIKYTVIALAVFGVLWIVSAYNKLVMAEEDMDSAWRQVEAQYRQRIDLVPSLISTVRTETAMDQEALADLSEARTRWLQAAAFDQREGQLLAAEQMDAALEQLLTIVEASPRLRATEAFGNLMTQLEHTDNRIVGARVEFNAAVRTYNSMVRRAPGTLIAGLLGFESQTSFPVTEETTGVPAVRPDDE
jgi:LemA protein